MDAGGKLGRRGNIRSAQQKILLLARSSISARQPVVVAETNRDFDRKQGTGNCDRLPNAAEGTKIAAI
jgi:hypothetical protein